MGLPGFSAAASLHHAHNLWKRGEHIHTVISDAASVGVRGSVVPQLCPPPGTCAKAFRLCRDPTAGHWADCGAIAFAVCAASTGAIASATRGSRAPAIPDERCATDAVAAPARPHESYVWDQ